MPFSNRKMKKLRKMNHMGARIVDIGILREGLKNCEFCKKGKYC